MKFRYLLKTMIGWELLPPPSIILKFRICFSFELKYV